MFVAGDLRVEDAKRLALALGARATDSKARAIALCAVRELQEETGLSLGNDSPQTKIIAGWSSFHEHGIAPNLSSLRLIARAVTPPVYPHRYDTHFFAAFCDQSLNEAASSLAPSGELLEPGWFTFQQAKMLDLPQITRMILEEAELRIAADPHLERDLPIPCFLTRRGIMRRITY